MITEEQIKKRIEICQSEIRSLLRAVEVDTLNSSTGSERLMVLKQRISEKEWNDPSIFRCYRSITKMGIAL